MMGIVLAAGNGTRLRPLTKLFPKSLLPVYNKPLVFYPLLTLKRAGINEVVIVTGANSRPQFQRLLGRGEQWGLRLAYAQQDYMGGLAHAIGVTEPLFNAGQRRTEREPEKTSLAVVLGDNVFEDDLAPVVRRFNRQHFRVEGRPVRGAMIVVTQVPDPERSGVATFKNGRVTSIVEKPKNPPSNWAITGFFLCDGRAYDFIRSIQPSRRGEMEWTDLMQYYLNEGTLTYAKLKGRWIDAGTFDSLLEANNFVAGHALFKKPASGDR